MFAAVIAFIACGVTDKRQGTCSGHAGSLARDTSGGIGVKWERPAGASGKTPC